MPSFLLKFTLVSKSALLFWKLLVSELLLGISEILHRSISAHVKIVPLLLMLFTESLTYSEPGTFPPSFSIICYNCCYNYYYLYYL
jgi:hypothetical protein